jgi:Zn-dependent protease
MILVALAGPATNFLLAALAGLVIRYFPNISSQGLTLLVQIVTLNLVLGIFNLIPIPPLDGSKVLASIFGFFDRSLMYWILELERFGFILIFIFLFSGIFQSILLPLVATCAKFLVGFDVF